VEISEESRNFGRVVPLHGRWLLIDRPGGFVMATSDPTSRCWAKVSVYLQRPDGAESADEECCAIIAGLFSDP
jgi:hypothetical protein